MKKLKVKSEKAEVFEEIEKSEGTIKAKKTNTTSAREILHRHEAQFT